MSIGLSRREQMAYTAGLIDGEGCFSLQKSGGTYRTTIQVQMTNQNVTRWLHEQYGGHFGHTAPTGNCEEMYSWVLASKPKIAFLIPFILPYLRVKSVPATILLEFCQRFNIGKSGRYSPEQYAEMERYHQLMMLANSKGPGSNEVKAKIVRLFEDVKNG